MGNLNEILFEAACECAETAADSPRTTGLVLTPVVARFVGFDAGDRPLVRLPADLLDEIVPARATLPLERGDLEADVLILCERGDPRRPVVIGVLQRPAAAEPEGGRAGRTPLRIDADGDRCLISAEREIVLSCGEASITLTRAGKILIKGNYILSRSTGYNKLKGAAIDIN